MPTFQTSGTFNTVTVSNQQLIDRAYGACKLTPQQVSGEMIDIGLTVLGLVLKELVSDSAPLQTLNKVLVPLIQGQTSYNLGSSTNDVKSAYYRSMSNVTAQGTVVSSGASYAFTFATNLEVDTIQIPWGVGMTIPAGITAGFQVQTSPDGINWTTVYTNTIFDALTGTQFYDMSNTNAQGFLRIIPTGAGVTLPVVGSFVPQLYNTGNDILMYRMNVDDYFNLTNKQFQGRPLQWWMDRQISPIMDLWPTPNALAAQNVMVVQRYRYLMDAGSLQQTIEMPPRWYFAVMYAVAAELAMCTPEVDPEWIPVVKAAAVEKLKRAWLEERDKAPIKFQPQISMYTR